MQKTRVGVGVAWFGVMVAFAACSGKTTSDAEAVDAGSGGTTSEPHDTGGTGANGDAGSAETPSETGGQTATGGRPASGAAGTGGTRPTGGAGTGGTPEGDAGDGGTPASSGAGGDGEEPSNTGGRASTGGAPATGGASGVLFGCGNVSCVEGRSYCYNYTPGTTGQSARTECKRLPEDCSDCSCLCPPTQPDGQCAGSSEDPSASCLCGGEPGKFVISCFGA